MNGADVMCEYEYDHREMEADEIGDNGCDGYSCDDANSNCCSGIGYSCDDVNRRSGEYLRDDVGRRSGEYLRDDVGKGSGECLRDDVNKRNGEYSYTDLNNHTNMSGDEFAEKEREFEAQTLTEELVFQRFGEGICCAAQVFGALAPAAGIDGRSARKIAAGFGSGMACAGTCGCVTGALMALGCRFGNFLPGQADRRTAFFEKRQRFLQEFTRRFGSCSCPQLLMDYDPADPGDLEKIKSQGLMQKVCAPMVLASIEIAGEILKEEM